MARVLRVPEHDGDSFVLLHLKNISDDTSHSLDLAIQGTDNVAPYSFTLERGKISTLKARNSPCNQDEWGTVLEFILLGKSLGDGHGDLLAGVEAVASIETEQYIEITIRKRTEGITQRLGSFQLAYAEGLEIDIFDWCGVAVQTTTATLLEYHTLMVRCQEQREEVERLNAQLEDLVTSKASHETELLEKFRDLLNAKKSKIRDQQRLLAAARPSPQRPTEVQTSRNSRGARKSGLSRPNKRKAEANNETESSEDEDMGTKKIDVDNDQALTDSNQDVMETPDEDETADEDDGANVPSAKSPVKSTAQVSAARGERIRGNNAKNDASGINNNKTSVEEDLPRTPPRRDLPFAKKHTAAAKAPIQDDDDTASEDDEL